MKGHPNMLHLTHIHLAFLLPLFPLALTQSTATSSCPVTVSTTVPAPVVASGYEVRLIASGLTAPRGIAFDSAGHLLVVQQDVGIVGLTLSDAGGTCVSVQSKETVVSDTTLNHGITFSPDGTTLYASSPEAVYSWDYSASTIATTSASTTLIANMTTSDHTTRTLLLSKFQNGTLIVTRGSTANIDPAASQLTSGHSQIKAFNLLNRTATYDFDTAGQLLGWGLRNDVGVAEHPRTGGLYSVENSVDQMTRAGVDIHENNPGEEMNYLGTLLHNTSPNQGANFGYPDCFSAWDVAAIPNNTNLHVGDQFAIGSEAAIAANDALCLNERAAPRLVFQAHMAPLDILFDANGSEAWVTFHGSWDRSPPVGYKLTLIQFDAATGAPVAPSTSLTAALDIVTNVDLSQCPDNCFRPVGLAWDAKGRLFFSSDHTGEIYVVVKSTNATEGTGTNSSATSTTTGATSTSATSTSAASTSAASSTASSTSGSSRLALYSVKIVWAVALVLTISTEWV